MCTTWISGALEVRKGIKSPVTVSTDSCEQLYMGARNPMQNFLNVGPSLQPLSVLKRWMRKDLIHLAQKLFLAQKFQYIPSLPLVIPGHQSTEL